MDNLEFLDAGEPANGEVAPVVEAEVEAPAEPVVAEAESEQKGPVRGPDGKFAKKEADDGPMMVPLKALHETRDELRALKAEVERSRQPQQQPQVPDMFEDPDGYQRHQNQMIQQAIYQERLNISGRFAAQQYGAETVTAAMEWGQARCVEDPAFNAAVMSNPDPVGYAVQQYQREQMLSQLGGDPKELQAFLAWKQAQQASPAETPQPQPERPTSSIAAATSAGGAQHTAIGPGVAFDNVIR